MTQIKHAINEEYKSEVFLMDCMEGMKQYPNDYFDLAVVDPPYGIDAGKMTMGSGTHKFKKGKVWDSAIPDEDYFKELFRVSKNQIIWGGNYFTEILPPSNNWIIWDKLNPNLSFSEAELAWCSIKKNTRIVKHYSAQIEGTGKIHPTQKAVKLYDWIFGRYAERCQKILDTHLGSQSSRISANKNKLHFTGFELDPDYFRDGNKRYEDHVSQLTLF